jgi:hypothetical protein
MSEPECARPDLAHRPIEKREPGFPCIFFARPRTPVLPPAHTEPHAQATAHPPTEPLIGVGRRTAQPVIEMQCHQPRASFGPVSPKQQKQRE